MSTRENIRLIARSPSITAYVFDKMCGENLFKISAF